MSLDREVNAVYEFFITAEDSSPSKRLTATTKVIVELLDINDNDPKFIYPTQPNHTIHASAYSKVVSRPRIIPIFTPKKRPNFHTPD